MDRVDFTDPTSRGRWLSSLRDCVHRLENMLVDLLQTAPLGREPDLRRARDRTRAKLRALFLAPGVYDGPLGAPVLKYCRCGTGPFEDDACPECGERDDIYLWPPGAHAHVRASGRS